MGFTLVDFLVPDPSFLLQLSEGLLGLVFTPAKLLLNIFSSEFLLRVVIHACFRHISTISRRVFLFWFIRWKGFFFTKKFLLNFMNERNRVDVYPMLSG